MELKTEEMYLELERLGTVLGVPVPQCHLTIETFDKNGKRTYYHKQRSHSWTRNAYNLMFSQLASKDADDATTFGGGYLNTKDTAGTVRSDDNPISIAPGLTSSSQNLRPVDVVGYGYLATSSIDTFGILVGTGTDAESFEDYVLQTKIATGTGGGQLAYGTHEAHAETYTGGTKTFKEDIVRYFNNNSGGSITINEIALVANGFAPGFSGGTKFLVARDKLSSGVVVADTGQLKVTYTISLVYAG